jgi:hypothetical protein
MPPEGPAELGVQFKGSEDVHGCLSLFSLGR